MRELGARHIEPAPVEHGPRLVAQRIDERRGDLVRVVERRKSSEQAAQIVDAELRLPEDGAQGTRRELAMDGDGDAAPVGVA
jgi:hypothetical protein